jgi:hypothetical protein
VMCLFEHRLLCLVEEAPSRFGRHGPTHQSSQRPAVTRPEFSTASGCGGCVLGGLVRLAPRPISSLVVHKFARRRFPASDLGID